MSSNPYRVPDAVVDDIVSAGASPSPPRPRAVVFTIIVGWLCLALCVYTLARFTFYFVYYWSYLSRMATPYLQVTLRAALVAYFFVMVISLHRRRKLGRWLGGLFIASFASLAIYAFIQAPAAKLDNLAWTVGAYVLGPLIVVGPIAWWFYAFTLSRKARAWFKWVPGPDAVR